MSNATRATFAGWTLTALLLCGSQVVLADDSLDAARAMYVSASYDDALQMLNRLRNGAHAQEEIRPIGLYRALCLFALGRTVEADQAMEEMVAQDPLYRPSDAEMSPHVRAAFTTVRRRVLPTIVQQEYAFAKTAFDRQEFASAAKGFEAVLMGLADPEVGSLATELPLSDLKILAIGFRDLSTRAAAPPPPPPPPVPPQPTPTPPPSLNRIYGSDDPNVVPPVTLKQQLPSFPQVATASKVGVVEVIIDETGVVLSATMRTPIDAAYDRAVIVSAKTWQYRPAMLDGVPVKYRKAIHLVVKPTT